MIQSELAKIKALANEILTSVEVLSASYPLAESIDVLKLSNRAASCLNRKGITYVGELVSLDKQSLWRIRNLGQRTFDEINSKDKSFGLRGWV